MADATNKKTLIAISDDDLSLGHQLHHYDAAALGRDVNQLKALAKDDQAAKQLEQPKNSSQAR